MDDSMLKKKVVAESSWSQVEGWDILTMFKEGQTLFRMITLP